MQELSSNLQKPGVQRSLSDVEHLRTVNTAIVIHLLDDESVGEGRDVQHVEQRGLAGSNFVTNLYQADITLSREKHWLATELKHFCNSLVVVNAHQDLNGSSGDFGGDAQSLEERGLLRTKSSILGRHNHITWGDSSSTGSCRYL